MAVTMDVQYVLYGGYTNSYWMGVQGRIFEIELIEAGSVLGDHVVDSGIEDVYGNVSVAQEYHLNSSYAISC